MKRATRILRRGADSAGAVQWSARDRVGDAGDQSKRTACAGVVVRAGDAEHKHRAQG